MWEMKRRNPAMSPAAQRLQQKLKGKVSSMDSMLRRSYTPAKTATPGGMTPGMTPGMKKRVGFVCDGWSHVTCFCLLETGWCGLEARDWLHCKCQG